MKKVIGLMLISLYCTSIFAQQKCAAVNLEKYKPYWNDKVKTAAPFLFLPEKERICAEQNNMVQEILTAIDNGYIVISPADPKENNPKKWQLELTSKGEARRVTVLGPKAGRILISGGIGAVGLFMWAIGNADEAGIGYAGKLVGGLTVIFMGLTVIKELVCDYTTVQAKNLISEVPALILGLSPQHAIDVLKDDKNIKTSVDAFIKSLHVLNYGDPKKPYELDVPGLSNN